MVAAPNASVAPLVLIVDPHADTRELYRCGLEALGYRVATEEHPADALHFARAARPDAVITELVLPDITGVTLARALRDLPETADTAVLAVTGMTRNRDLQAARHAGCTEVLVKPCLLDVLAAALTRVLDQSRRMRERSNAAGAHAAKLRARSQRILLQSAVIRSRQAGGAGESAPVLCPGCCADLRWREHQTASGARFDYFHPCPAGCGEYYFIHSRRLMRRLR